MMQNTGHLDFALSCFDADARCPVPTVPALSRASTPGPDSLQVAVWNVGMATETAFAATRVVGGAGRWWLMQAPGEEPRRRHVHPKHWLKISEALIRNDPTVQYLAPLYTGWEGGGPVQRRTWAKNLGVIAFKIGSFRASTPGGRTGN